MFLMDNEIATIRAYTRQKSQKSRHENKKSRHKSEFEKQLDFDRILVFDTETTTDLYQNLKFGYFKIYQNNVLDYHGLFYDVKPLKNNEYEIVVGGAKGLVEGSRKAFERKFQELNSW